MEKIQDNRNTNLCEDWLHKIFDDKEIVKDPLYMGNMCCAKLDSRTMAHFSFEYVPGCEHSDCGKKLTGLLIKIVNTEKGPVDQVAIPFTSAWPYGETPYIRLEWPNGPGEWANRKPDITDMNMLKHKVKAYINMFR